MSRSRSSRNRSSGRRSGNNNSSASSNNDSANNDYDNNDHDENDNDNDRSLRTDRYTTETKEATKTTELIAFVLAVVGVAVTAFTVDEDPDFGAERAWLYITILTVGYMISRGLAKAGSQEPYDYDDR